MNLNPHKILHRITNPLHQWLSLHSRIYSTWHENKIHGKIHLGVLLTIVCSFFFLLNHSLTVTPPQQAQAAGTTKYARTAGGNWSADATWSTTSGGGADTVKPTAEDDVIFDANSGNVTIDATAVAKSLDCTGYTNTLSGSSAITVVGAATSTVSVKIAGTITWTGTLNLNPTAADTNIELTSNGKQLRGIVIAGNSSGDVYILDALNVWTTGFTLTSGILHLDGLTDNAGLSHSVFSYNQSGVTARTANFGAATLTITGGDNIRFNSDNGTNLTFTCGTSTIRFTASNTTAYLGTGQTYATLKFELANFNQNLNYSTATIGTLWVTGNASQGNILNLTSGYTNVVTGEFKVQGNSAANRVIVRSGTFGSVATLNLTGATVSNSSNVDFRDITFSGSPNFSAITGGSGDCKGNTGATFTTADDWYWNGSGTRNFSDYTYWYTATNGGGSQMASTLVPLPQDTGYFDADSIDGATTVDQDMARIPSINFTGVVAMNFHIDNIAQTSYGGLVLVNNVTVTSSSSYALTFEGRGAYSLGGNSSTLACSVNVNMIGGTLTLTSNYLSNSTLTLNNGTLDADTYNVTAGFFNSSNSNARTLLMGSGTWTILATTATITWQMTTITGLTNPTTMGETSTLVIGYSGVNNQTFAGGGCTYGSLAITGGSTQIVTFTGSNSFATFTIGAPKTVKFTAGTTTTVTSFVATGTAVSPIVVTSATGATHILSDASGTNTVSYCTISYSIAQGGATWDADDGTNTDSGNNTGWVFISAPNAPTIGTPQAISTTSVRWTFTDNASNETGFKVYDGANALKATCASADLTYCDETGLSVNTLYNDRYVVAYNGLGNSANSATAAGIYTLANVPSTPTVNNTALTSSLTTIINVNSNPASTEFAISCDSDTTFLNFTTNACEDIANDADHWRTYTNWGGAVGFTDTGLLANTNHTYKTMARNGDAVNTALSSGASKYTLIETPTGITFGAITDHTIALSASGTLSNLASGSSGLYFTQTSGNPGGGGVGDGFDTWTQTNSLTDTGLNINTTYSYKVKARNGDGTETVYSSPDANQSTTYTLQAPSNVALTADSTTQITVSWTDNSSSETGNKVYISTTPNADCSLATYPGTPDYTTAADAVSQAATSLAVNTQYCAKVVATNGSEDTSAAYAAAPFYTLANIPSAPTVNTPTISSLKVIINQNSNPDADTRYAIYNSTAGKYVKHADGSLQDNPDWQLYADWGGASGFLNAALSGGTSYIYKVKAENGDNIATAFSETASASTLTSLLATTNETSGVENQIATPFASQGNNSSIQNQSVTDHQNGYKLVIKVVDTNGNPVAGAKVTIHSVAQEATSDENGIVEFKNVEPGDHKIVIAYNNYVAQQTINLSGDTKNINITMTLQPNTSLFRKYWIIIGCVSLLLVLSLLFIIFRSKLKNAYRFHD